MKKSRILAGIWMLFLVLAYLVSASITIGIAAVATVLLCFFCFFLSIAMKNKVTCYFEVPDMAEKEQQVYGKLIFENHRLLPAGRLRADLLFQNLLTGEKEICHLDSMAAGKEKTETKWSVCSNCCGAIRISVQKLLVSDMLGLFLSEQKLNISDTMIVLPEMKTVEVQVGDSFTTDWESIQYSEQKKGDDPGETFGIREYQPGDSTKMIHWKISQKLGELYVKEPGLPVENAVLLFFETANLTGDSRTSDQAELMEKLISVSENLTEKGMHHKIGWYDQKKEQLCMEEIDSADNLAQIIHGLLSLERKEKTFTGLQEYAQKYQEQPFGHILYFTAEDPGNLADLFAWQCSFGVKHEETQKNSKKARNRTVRSGCREAGKPERKCWRSTCLFLHLCRMVSYGDAVLQGISGDDSFWQCGSDSACDGRSCKWTKRKEIHTKNRA